ncbi:hypothetical protein XELAEV_18019064mg [Xenopus laevis]|uniref:Uncharacterized protein n=2 Tax=Xenopus laevis TaxID=8355 RepID=A0A974DG21_XENLA|nr:interferon-like LOC124629385 precursor [Xenopus laevis]ANQ43333.1 type I interferon 21 [Xenopus laevis]OCT90450.1 hypothetical protein XELAEV_18019064mg [Xenopus laevis]
MAPGLIKQTNCLETLLMVTTILYLLVQPSSAGSRECPWFDKRGELVDNEILKVFDNLQPTEENKYNCRFKISNKGFFNNRSQEEAAAIVFVVFRETKKFYKKNCSRLSVNCNQLLHLLQQQIDKLHTCNINTVQYKEATQAISKEYRKLRKKGFGSNRLVWFQPFGSNDLMVRFERFNRSFRTISSFDRTVFVRSQRENVGVSVQSGTIQRQRDCDGTEYISDSCYNASFGPYSSLQR